MDERFISTDDVKIIWKLSHEGTRNEKKYIYKFL